MSEFWVRPIGSKFAFDDPLTMDEVKAKLAQAVGDEEWEVLWNAGQTREAVANSSHWVPLDSKFEFQSVSSARRICRLREKSAYAGLRRACDVLAIVMTLWFGVQMVCGLDAVGRFAAWDVRFGLLAAGCLKVAFAWFVRGLIVVFLDLADLKLAEGQAVERGL